MKVCLKSVLEQMVPHLVNANLCERMSSAHDNFPRGGGVGGGLGTCQNFVKSYFSRLAIFLSIFLGFAKCPLGLTNFQLFFGSSNFYATHFNPLHDEHTVLKNMKYIVVLSYLFELSQTLHLQSFYFFLALNFGAFYFLGV